MRPNASLTLRRVVKVSDGDRKNLAHVKQAHTRFEDLWAKGIDYSAADVETARAGNRLLHLDMDFTGECKLKCFYCDRTPDRYSDVPRRVELTTQQRKDIISQAKGLGGETVEFPGAGEPMMDPGFWDVLEHIAELGMTSVIFISGYQLNDMTIDRLYDLGATITIKHNSDDPRIADKMVGVKGYGEIANRASLDVDGNAGEVRSTDRSRNRGIGKGQGDHGADCDPGVLAAC